MSDAPEVICNVSNSQLSVARFYGCCRYNGRTYYYCPVSDTLTRDDVLAARKEWRVVRAGDGDRPDEFLGGPHRTRAKALQAAKADRSGRLVVLFGLEGIDRLAFMVNGKPPCPTTASSSGSAT